MKGGADKVRDWFAHLTRGYAGVEVRDLSASWYDGLALCAVLHR
jgi:hypothetical protein